MKNAKTIPRSKAVKISPPERLSTDPYKGVRDFYPEDAFIQNYIFDTMAKTARAYGYVRYDASVLEDTALYRTKSSVEIVNNQTYTFLDRGGREVTLRPEMTPTVARMIARKRKELSFPLRWYSISNMFRYERPQRGRLREHWQLNADIFGVEDVDAEIEIIMMAHDIMTAFGAVPGSFKIRINNRRVMNTLFCDIMGLEKPVAQTLARLLDGRSKIKEDEFFGRLKLLLKDKKQREILASVLSAGELEELPGVLADHPGVTELKRIMDGLPGHVSEQLFYDPSLVRGFDYYTGVVFEIFDEDPANSRSLFGGGRYDDLLDIFGSQKMTGAGFGMGDVTIRRFLEAHGLLPEYRSGVDLYICTMGTQCMQFVQSTAACLRGKGLSVAVDLTRRKVASQIKSAVRKSVPFIICVGEDEMKTGKFKVKRLEDGSEFVMDARDIPDFIMKQAK